MTRPPETTNAPTMGLGCVRPRPRSASTRASSMSCSSLLLLALALVDQLLELAHELAHVLERPVHRGEPHVGDLVEAGELPHHRLADEGGGDLLLAHLLEAALDAVDDGLDLLGGDWPFAAGQLQAGDDLLPVEGLAAAVLLHHHGKDLFHPLVGGEATLAGEAFAPPPDHGPLVGEPRVDHLVVLRWAEGALHFRLRSRFA